MEPRRILPTAMLPPPPRERVGVRGLFSLVPKLELGNGLVSQLIVTQSPSMGMRGNWQRP
jgi:hypothetical protein